jgi:hypothetical protein
MVCSSSRKFQYSQSSCDSLDLTPEEQALLEEVDAPQLPTFLTLGPQPSLDLVGQTFGNLTVLKAVGRHPKRGKVYLCRCECGNECVAPTTRLRSGKKKSCGCRVWGKKPKR